MFDAAAPDPIETIRVALGSLGAESRDAWTSAEQSSRVLELLAVTERLRAEVARAVSTWDARRAWAVDGSNSAPAWLAEHASLTRVEAARLVRTARVLQRNPETAAALADGSISYSHVGTIATATQRREDLYARHERVVVEGAQSLRPEAFVSFARRWRELADEELATADAAVVFERRYLRVSPTFGGRVIVEGELDPHGGSVLLAALRAFDHPDSLGGAQMPRSASQRRADALVELAARAMGRGEGGARVPVGVDVVIHLDDVGGAGGMSAAIDGVGPIATEVARRMVCDAAIGRVIMRGRSEVLDVGRRTRVPSTAQRRALVRRDRGCVFPGCDRPHEWSDAHHLVSWLDGGATDLDNLVLLCRRHHTLCHEGAWQLVRGPDGAIEVRRPPPGPKARSPGDVVLAA